MEVKAAPETTTSPLPATLAKVAAALVHAVAPVAQTAHPKTSLVDDTVAVREDYPTVVIGTLPAEQVRLVTIPLL